MNSNSFDGESMPRRAILLALARIRQEWQDADTGSLIDQQASVGLLLADLAAALGLTHQEQAEVLGEDLYHELFDILEYA